jgi:hypothetical protein
MEKSGPGAEDFEFRPPLFATPAAKAAEAYAEARRDAESAERAPEDEKDEATETEEKESWEKEEKEDPKKDGKEAEKVPAEKDAAQKTDAAKEKEKETDRTESAEAKAKAKAKAKAPAPPPPPKSPSPRWGDGDRVVAGDPALAAWLDSRGWGEYAASFAAYGATVEGLRRLTTQDLENLDVRAEVREKMLAAARGTATATATAPEKEGRAGEKQKRAAAAENDAAEHSAKKRRGTAGA